MAILTEPANEFHLSPQLAIELRLKIWEFALYLTPRIVELCQLQDEKYLVDVKDEHGEDDGTINTAAFYSPTKVPVLLQPTNRECRSVALQHYTLSFPNLNGPHPGRIWFNSHLDALYFPAWCFQYDLLHFERGSSPETKNNIQKLAREKLIWFSPPWYDGSINNDITISQFGGLEEYIFVLRDLASKGCICCLRIKGPEFGVPELKWAGSDEEILKVRRGTEKSNKEILDMRRDTEESDEENLEMRADMGEDYDEILEMGGDMEEDYDEIREVRRHTEKVLLKIKARKEEKGEIWRVPRLKFAVLLRDGMWV